MILPFLETLRYQGKPILDPPPGDLFASILRAGKDKPETDQVAEFLQDWFDQNSAELAGPLMDFHPEAALWGATTFFRSACFYIFRDLGESEVQTGLSDLFLPDPDLPGAHYSADLCLRSLPALYRLARKLGEDDPLVARMELLAANVPLSSIGIPIPLKFPDAIREQRGLTFLCIERALERNCRDFFEDQFFRDEAERALGGFARELGQGLLAENFKT